MFYAFCEGADNSVYTQYSELSVGFGVNFHPFVDKKQFILVQSGYPSPDHDRLRKMEIFRVDNAWSSFGQQFELTLRMLLRLDDKGLVNGNVWNRHSSLVIRDNCGTVFFEHHYF